MELGAKIQCMLHQKLQQVEHDDIAKYENHGSQPFFYTAVITGEKPMWIPQSLQSTIVEAPNVSG